MRLQLILLRGFFIILVIAIGLYPLIYFLQGNMSDMGLLSTKPDWLKESAIWSLAFKLHILGGGLALLSGWSQFLKKWRTKHLAFHRLLGRIYLGVVLVSGLSSLYMAFYATGGLIPGVGFGMLGVLWLITSYKALASIKMGEITSHQKWMIRSFALTFAAVTLRIWLPLLQFVLLVDFFVAYAIVAWLCWVPNLIIAEFALVRRI
jgi:uncharacterized membrane protein